MNKRERFRGSSKSESINLEKLKKGLEVLASLIEESNENIESLGIQLTADGRIDPEQFTDIYDPDEIRKDQEHVERLEEKFVESDRKKPAQHEEFKKVADLFEQIIPVVFKNAFRAKGFIAIRTAKHDDYNNNVDTLIIHKKTGRIICSIDETNSSKERVVSGSKLDMVVSENRKGVQVKYAVKRREDGQFYPDNIEGGGVPLVYLSISREKVLEFIDDIASGACDIEDRCGSLFDDLIYSLYRSFDTIKVSMPEQGEKIDGLINIVSKETGVEPSLHDLVGS